MWEGGEKADGEELIFQQVLGLVSGNFKGVELNFAS